MSDTQSSSAPKALPVKYKDFSKRLEQACQGNTQIPQMQYGRLTWFQKEFVTRFDFTISAEGVRRWFTGQSMPKPNVVTMLAEILNVDDMWLSNGRNPDLDRSAIKLRKATADGMVNIVAGFMQTHGAKVAFPQDNDAKASEANIDIYAIIKGVQYSFCIIPVFREAAGLRIAVPVVPEGVLIIAVDLKDDLAVDLIEVEPELLTAAGKRAGGATELRLTSDLKVGGQKVKMIKNFRDRL